MNPANGKPVRSSISYYQSAASGCGDKATVKGDHGCPRLLGGQEHTAVWELEVGLGSHEGETPSGVFRQVLCRDVQLIERRDGSIELTRPGRANQDFGNGDRAGAQRLAGGIGQQRRGELVMGVATVQMRNEHAGVEDDHAGQSSRNLSR
jgi:hypothetical protein